MRKLFWQLRDYNWPVFLIAVGLGVFGVTLGGLVELLFWYSIFIWVAGKVADLVGYERLTPANDIDFLDKIDQIIDDPEGGDRLRMIVCMVRLGLVMAAADGRIDEEELHSIRAFFLKLGSPPEVLAFVDGAMLNSTTHLDLERVIQEVRRIAHKEERRIVLLAMLAVAAADGHFHEKEIAIFFEVGAQLEFSAYELDRLIKSSLGQAPEEDVENRTPGNGMTRSTALATLGLSDGANGSEVRSAYRDLAKRYHPDRVSHLGPEFEKLAGDRMRQINDAYMCLKPD